jgi:hypothetical protein
MKSVHALDGTDGVLVWLDHHPFPLRIEYEHDVVAKTWGASDECHASKPRMNVACEELKRLSATIRLGSSRVQSYQSVIDFPTQLSKQMGAFRPKPADFGTRTSTADYRSYLLSIDAWQFSGLEKQSKFEHPFNSTVTVYFTNGHLSRITHWSTPFELP